MEWKRELNAKKMPNKTRNVIVLMAAIQVDFRFLLFVRFGSFAICWETFSVRWIMDPMKEMWAAGWSRRKVQREEVTQRTRESQNENENQEFDKANGIVYSSFTVFTQAKLTLTAPTPSPSSSSSSSLQSRKMAREAKQQQSNQIQTLGQSIGSEVYANAMHTHKHTLLRTRAQAPS